MWYKNPWLLLMSLLIATILVAGTAVTGNLVVVKNHNLEQRK